MSQDYTIKDVRISARKDDHGNTWTSVTFDELGEPVAYLTKDPSKLILGTKLFGEVREEKKRAGGIYLRFRPAMREEFIQAANAAGDDRFKQHLVEKAAGNPQPRQQPQSTDWDDRQATITASWAVGKAADALVNIGVDPRDEASLEEMARRFVTVMLRVKVNGPSAIAGETPSDSDQASQDELVDQVMQSIADDEGNINEPLA